MSISVRLRLPVPEGRPGDVVVVSEARAAALVDRRYATFVEKTAAPAAADEPAYEPPAAAVPKTELPEYTALKAEWEAVAESLGIDLYREDGTKKTKDELIEAVEEATG